MELTSEQKKLWKLLEPYRDIETPECPKSNQIGVIVYMIMARDYGVESEMIEILEKNKDKSLGEIGAIFASQPWFPPPMEIVDEDI